MVDKSLDGTLCISNPYCFTTKQFFLCHLILSEETTDQGRTLACIKILYYISYLGISKKIVGSEFLPCGFVSSDNYWTHSGPLKNLIEFIVVLIFSPLPELEQPAPKYIHFVQSNCAVNPKWMLTRGLDIDLWTRVN